NPTGAARHRTRYRPGHDLPEPEGGRADKHREFIRTKYEDKRWYGTPDDLVKDREREAEREEAKAKRDAKHAGKRQERIGATSRPRRGSGDRGLRRSEPAAAAAAAAAEPAPAPAKQADLLDFLSENPAPAPQPALAPAPAQGPPAAAQPWGAFGDGGNATGGIIQGAAPVSTAPASGFASWAAFGDAPGMPQAAAPPPQQQQQQPQPAAFGFQETAA
ncbi:unnamed protein product, partial [Hapterophycus canaliculatus]